MGIAIKAEDVCKVVGTKKRETTIVDALSVEIHEGEYVAITGKSGSGKSTILNLLSGMDVPSSGRVFFMGNDISMMTEKELTRFRQKSVGIVLQGIHLIPFLTAEDNIRIAAYNKKQKNLSNKIDKFFEIFGMSEDDKRKYPSMMSGGENQRIAIMRALINKPKVLFFDEPTGALNMSSTKDILKYMGLIHKSGQTIITVTHDPTCAVQAERVLYIEDGRIISDMPISNMSLGERRSAVLSLMSKGDEN